MGMTEYSSQVATEQPKAVEAAPQKKSFWAWLKSLFTKKCCC
jgi:hypothetical protein